MKIRSSLRKEISTHPLSFTPPEIFKLQNNFFIIQTTQCAYIQTPWSEFDIEKVIIMAEVLEIAS
jgi:hypothetical protein